MDLAALSLVGQTALIAADETKEFTMQFHPDAAKIKRWREERHWSQDHLADLAGIGTRTVQRIERGEAASNESVMALAAAFNVDVMALTVDPRQQAAAAKDAQASDGLNALKLSFWIHFSSYLFGMLVFIAIGVSTPGPSPMTVAAAWWTVGLAGHALTVVIVILAQKYKPDHTAK